MQAGKPVRIDAENLREHLRHTRALMAVLLTSAGAIQDCALAHRA